MYKQIKVTLEYCVSDNENAPFVHCTCGLELPSGYVLINLYCAQFKESVSQICDLVVLYACMCVCVFVCVWMPCVLSEAFRLVNFFPNTTILGN